ncbi:MAG: NAD(P)-dependent oxidoreductase [Acidobacteria bacterium]|nr:NAD(P)-dependent oxidoreductase [Acidobacteriota bacterium]
MRVLVTGGTGYLGRPLIHALVARGHAVRAVVRAASACRLADGAEAVVADPLEAGSYSAAGCEAFVHLIGVSHPSPWKAEQFQAVDVRSVEVAVRAAREAAISHFIYLSVAHPAPVMRAYIAARERCEQMVCEAGLNATLVRPWYVLGPGHRWPYILKPIYRLLESVPSKRAAALRLGLVTREQMIAALVAAAEHPASGVRVLEVPEIRKAALAAGHS